MIYNIIKDPATNIKGYAASANLHVTHSYEAWIEAPELLKPAAYTTVYVVHGAKKSLLGREVAKRMKLLELGASVHAIESTQENELFPTIPIDPVNFAIDPSAAPIQRPYTNLPVNYVEPAKRRLLEMERRGIIKRVAKSKWLSGLSAVPKGKSDFRLVVNMRAPNRAIRRMEHLMPRVENMKAQLANARFFTKLDIESAFHHVPLSQSASELTGFVGPNNIKYQFTRLVFGVNCAPEIFQSIMESILQDIEGTIVYIDDVLIFGPTVESLRERTEKVHERLSENNLTLNKGKCEYEKESLTFLGHRLSKEGFHIDEEKVRDIRNFREPKTAAEVKSFVGLVTFIGSYLEKFTEATETLRAAAEKKIFEFGVREREAFLSLKTKVINCTTAQGFFNIEDETFLYTDASPSAVGAVLVQRDAQGTHRIISFASKALTPTERKYPQTQREALAVVWATERFHYYLLGKTFTIRTDAKGMKYIFDRDAKEPKSFIRRAEGWALRLSAFDYEIEFVEGDKNIADPSSRLYEGPPGEAYDESDRHYDIAALEGETLSSTPFDVEMLPPQQVALETAKDLELQRVVTALTNDVWDNTLSGYEKVKDELYLTEGVLAKSGRATIPIALRAKALYLAHKGHQGQKKTKSILLERVWWPGAAHDASEYVKHCHLCILSGRKEKPAPMSRIPMPTATFDVVAIDYAGPYAQFGGAYIVSLVDYHSRLLITKVMRSTTFTELKTFLDETFERFGRPKAMKSDNGPPFNSAEYRVYCRNNGIEAIFSWPLWPQQNGMVERSMQTIGKAMQHASATNGDFRSALREATVAYNSATHSVTGEIPLEVALGRHIRASLPLVRPATVNLDTDAMRQRDWEAKTKAKHREDSRRGAREPSMEIGDKVVLRRPQKRKGDTNFLPDEHQVIAIKRGDVTLKAPDDTIIRRNVTFMKKLPNARPSITAQERPAEEIESADGARRSTRERRPPPHMELYARQVSFDVDEM